MELCEELNYTELYKQYVRTWRKISPETLFELVVFGYMQRRFSTCRLRKHVENVAAYIQACAEYTNR